MAREHNDLRIEFELYYCLMQVGAWLGLFIQCPTFKLLVSYQFELFLKVLTWLSLIIGEVREPLDAEGIVVVSKIVLDSEASIVRGAPSR